MELGKGLSAMGLSVDCAARSVGMSAQRYDSARNRLLEMKLRMTRTGLKGGFEISVDLLESLTGA